MSVSLIKSPAPAPAVSVRKSARRVIAGQVAASAWWAIWQAPRNLSTPIYPLAADHLHAASGLPTVECERVMGNYIECGELPTEHGMWVVANCALLGMNDLNALHALIK